MSVGVVWLFIAMPHVMAQQASGQQTQNLGAGISGGNAGLPYVNSGGLRLRDFPSTAEGKILALLDQGQRLEVTAVTQWKDRIGGQNFPWYYVSVTGTSGLIGWVYGEYVTFEAGSALDSQTVRSVSHQQINRTFLVLQLFRRLLGTDSRNAATTWLRGLPEVGASRPQIAFSTDYSIRTYRTDFGEVVVRFHPHDARQLVLSLTLDKPVGGLPVRIGEPVVQVKSFLGTNSYSRGQAMFYRGIPEIGDYSVTIETRNGVVTAINASALLT